MPAFGRVGGAWVGGDLRAREAGAWTGERDNVFGRDGAAWLQIQPESNELLPPANLAVDAEWDAATLTWVDPTQPLVPTHTQYRIPEITPVWTELSYGTTTATWAALASSTEYQFQVRYVVRVDGEITVTGPTATAFFTTLAPAGPGTPAPDPLGTGPDSIILWPSTVGTPGAVGGPDCWWEYVIQRIDVDEITLLITYFDTDLTAELAGNVGDLEIDFIASTDLVCGDAARTKYREVCNAVPGAWEYTEAYLVPCDWDAACGGIPANIDFNPPAWLDAIMATPRICVDLSTGVRRVEDLITGNTYGSMPGLYYAGIRKGSHELNARFGNAATGVALLAGFNANLNSLTNTTDASFSIGVRLANQPAVDMAGGMLLVRWGNQVRIGLQRTGVGFMIVTSFPKAGGGYFSLPASAELALNEYHSITLTMDQNGHKILYVNGVSIVSDVTGVAVDFDKLTFNQSLEVYGNSLAWVRRIGAWDRVLTAIEVMSLVTSKTPYEAAVLALGATAHWSLNELVEVQNLGDVAAISATPNLASFFPMITKDP